MDSTSGMPTMGLTNFATRTEANMATPPASRKAPVKAPAFRDAFIERHFRCRGMGRANDEIPIYCGRRQRAVGQFRGVHVTGRMRVAGRRRGPRRGFLYGRLSQEAGEETKSAK